MRVLIVEHKDIYGGGQVALMNLLRAWQQADAPIEPAVVCPPDAALIERVRALNVPCFPLDLGAIEKRRGAAWNVAQRVSPTRKLLALTRRLRTQVMYANGALSFLACALAARLARVPVVWVEHNTTLPDGAILKWLIGQAAHIVVVCDAIREQFVSLVPDAANKISVLYNGVAVERYAGAEAMDVKTLCGWSENALMVGTVSRLSVEKGIPYFLDAASQIAAKLPAARFLIVGDGPKRSELEAQARRLGIENKVCFTGFREDVPQALRAMDLFVLPSLAEAFPVAVLEAMAAGRAVVATDVGGVREIVRAGETGVLVPPRDAPALAAATLRLLDDPETRRAMGAKGYARVAAGFRIEKIAAEYLQVLEAACRA